MRGCVWGVGVCVGVCDVCGVGVCVCFSPFFLYTMISINDDCRQSATFSRALQLNVAGDTIHRDINRFIHISMVNHHPSSPITQ